MYKIIPVTDKLFVGHDLEWIGKVSRDLIFNLIYRDGSENMAYVKRFKMPSFIMDKEYRLFPEHERSKILLLTFGEGRYARANLMPSGRAKTNIVDIDFSEYLLKNAAAKGKRLSSRVVRRVYETTEKMQTGKKSNLTLPGLDEQLSNEPEPDISQPTEGEDQEKD
jgi:topoisomerase-4 subunit A